MDAKKELIKHLKAAIELENQGIDKYREFAQSSKSHYARLLFERLIKEEESHVAFFGMMLMQLEKNKALDRARAEQALKEIDHTEVFETGKSGISENYISALVYVVDVEERTMNYYSELADSTEDEVTREIFQNMARYEKKHYDTFKTELEYAKNVPHT